MCGIDEDQQLLRDVASTVVAYYFYNITTAVPAYGEMGAALWTRAIDVCLTLNCSLTSGGVSQLPTQASRLVAKTYEQYCATHGTHASPEKCQTAAQICAGRPAGC